MTSTTYALSPQDWEVERLGNRPGGRAVLIALLLSLVLHGMLWHYVRGAEILQDRPDRDAAAVISVRLTQKAPFAAPDPDRAADTDSAPAAPAATEVLPALPDTPQQTAPTVRPETTPLESLSTAKPADVPPEEVDRKAGVIFDPRLRRKLDNFRYRRPLTPPDGGVYFDNYGDEWVRHGDSCSKVIGAVDHQDQALLGIPAPCKGGSREDDFERGFRERLRARGLK